MGPQNEACHAVKRVNGGSSSIDAFDVRGRGASLYSLLLLPGWMERRRRLSLHHLSKRQMGLLLMVQVGHQ
jgi:hypothetical protein